MSSEVLNQLRQTIKVTPGFPKEGINFLDFFPLFQDHLAQTTEELTKLINWDDIDYIVGVESRGFIIASALAAKLRKGMIPIRKKGKLPPPTISQSYSLEYGEDTLEIGHNVEAKKNKVVLVDDVLATGGTLKASLSLCEKAGYQVQNSIVLIDICKINNMRNTHDVKSLFQF